MALAMILLVAVAACAVALVAIWSGSDDGGKNGDGGGGGDGGYSATYSVTFESFGSEYAKASAREGSTISAPARPSVEGYDFGGWFMEDDCVNIWDFQTHRVYGDITLYAKWSLSGAGQGGGGSGSEDDDPAQPPTYRVTLELGDGTKVEITGVGAGAKLPAPPNPARAGHTFEGWYKDSAFGARWNFDEDRVTADTVLYAKWRIDTYDVSFDTQGGPAVRGTTAEYGSTIAAPDDPVWEGRTFVAWYRESDCVREWIFDSDAVTGPTVLYAKWDKATYTVAFDSQGGSEVQPKASVEHGAKIDAPSPAPTRDGHAFVAWYREAAYVTAWNFEEDAVTENMTLHAKWVQTHTVAFDSHGGTAVDPITSVVHGSKITAPDEPTREGYSFGGWFKEEACTNPWNFGTDEVTANRILHAKWTIKTYAVSFDSHGGTAVDPITSVVHGSKITAPTEPTRDGYSFGGWFKEEACTNPWNFGTDEVTANRILHAKWTIKTYTVSFDSHGGSSVAQITSVVHGAKITAPSPAPTRDGYEFAAWYKESGYSNAWNFASDTVTENMTLHAKWSALGSLVTFDYQNATTGKTMESMTIADGQASYKMPVPGRAPYTFGGWYTAIGGGGSILADEDGDSLDAWSGTANITAYAYWKGSPGQKYTSLGSGTCSVRSTNDSLKGAVVIPEYYDGMRVVSIADEGFKDCLIASVSIPETVVSMGESAFDGCTNLESVRIPSGVTVIPLCAFLYCESLESVEFLGNVTEIGESAFEGCGIRSITLPDTVESIGGWAFQYADFLTSVTLPAGLKSIGELAFANCMSLENITLPDGLESIGEEAFLNCECLTEMYIPASVTTMDARVFKGCDSGLHLYTGWDEAPEGWNSTWNAGIEVEWGKPRNP
ncbi:MAG: InlB B-repeat-containing protein [Candidatus Methanoplasma sp.]|jgi:uncharacterized repeat protein (TIGR02543 family)|nr:InlB B-repeat-containing protein [Candidatus Methanoplasma sp.]